MTLIDLMTDERARAGKLFASGAVPGASFLFDALRREAEQHLDKAQTAASVASKAAKKAAKPATAASAAAAAAYTAAAAGSVLALLCNNLAACHLKLGVEATEPAEAREAFERCASEAQAALSAAEDASASLATAAAAVSAAAAVAGGAPNTAPNTAAGAACEQLKTALEGTVFKAKLRLAEATKLRT